VPRPPGVTLLPGDLPCVAWLLMWLSFRCCPLLWLNVVNKRHRHKFTASGDHILFVQKSEQTALRFERMPAMPLAPQVNTSSAGARTCVVCASV
jgi:hypothetical protein